MLGDLLYFNLPLDGSITLKVNRVSLGVVKRLAE